MIRYALLLAVSTVSAFWSAAQTPTSPGHGSEKLVLAVVDENGVAVARARVQLQAAKTANPELRNSASGSTARC